ncbi:MAG: hypothetical protein PHQ04_10270 [Opitutaceae bacterium]|nr:hypothetical protein [Opitutaceae bacterium]
MDRRNAAKRTALHPGRHFEAAGAAHNNQAPDADLGQTFEKHSGRTDDEIHARSNRTDHGLVSPGHGDLVRRVPGVTSSATAGGWSVKRKSSGRGARSHKMVTVPQRLPEEAASDHAASTSQNTFMNIQAG